MAAVAVGAVESVGSAVCCPHFSEKYRRWVASYAYNKKMTERYELDPKTGEWRVEAIEKRTASFLRSMEDGELEDEILSYIAQSLDSAKTLRADRVRQIRKD